jgi:hypothetical protein
MSDVSAFDPALFLDAQQSEVNEALPPLPVENPASPDGLYTAIIGEVKTDTGIIGKGERSGEPWLSMVVPLKLEIPQQLQEGLGYPPVYQLTDRVFLDLTPGGKGIDNSKGKNRRQKEYRDALDLNKPGDIWSWRKAVGQAVKVKAEQEMYQGRPVAKPGAILRRG